MPNISKLGEEAIKTLETRLMGGVSKESAEKGIKQVAEVAEKEIAQLNETVTSQSSRITQLSADVKTAQEALAKANAEGAYKTTQLETSEKALKETREKLAVSKATKIGKPKTLPNGNIETVKVNKNGARETLETLPDGKKVSAKFENIDGDVAKYYFDPVTGKVTKVYKNVGGKETLTEFKDGKAVTKEVNVRKAVPEKPTLVNKEQIGTRGNNALYRKTYSNGSYEEVEVNTYLGRTEKVEKFDGKANKVEETKFEYDKSSGELSYRHTNKYNEDGSLRKQETAYSDGKANITEYKDGKAVSKVRKNVDVISYVKASVDDFGNIPEYGFAKEVAHTFPKDSLIKKATTEFNSRFSPNKDTLVMKDGSIVDVKLHHGNYYPMEATLQKKGAEPVVLNHEEMKQYLESIGYTKTISNHSQNNYFDNVL